jgi:HEAT repeat protein
VVDGLLGRSAIGLVFVVITVFTLVLLLAAMALSGAAGYLRIRNHRKGIRWGRLEALWEPLVLDVLSGGPASTVHDAVGSRDRKFFIGFLMRYARRVRGEELAVVRSLATPYLPDIVREFAGEGPEHRARTVQTVATLGLEAQTGFIVAALSDPAPLVAVIAASALLREGRHEHLDVILDTLPRFSVWSRMFLARTLAGAGSGAADKLRSVLADPSKPTEVRAVVADALRELADLQAADLAADIVAGGEERELMATCLRLLSEVGRPMHLEVALREVASGDPVVRGAAAQAVASLGGRGQALLLEGLLRDESPWVALHAATGLARMGATEALVALGDSPDARRSLAREALAGT